MFEAISQHEYPASKYRELVSKTKMLQTTHQTSGILLAKEGMETTQNRVIQPT
jgi:hypothetical protein